MTTDRPALVAIGGFPGAGKSLLARRLSRELSLPRLCSDAAGGAIRRSLGDGVGSSDAFWAGYEVLFTLVEEFLGDGCSVIVDMSLGWDFQWKRLDAIRHTCAEAVFLPILLQCPHPICVERVGRRHEESPGAYPPVERFLQQEQLPKVWDYLATLDRPDVHRVDARPDPDRVYAETLRYLSDRAGHLATSTRRAGRGGHAGRAGRGGHSGRGG